MNRKQLLESALIFGIVAIAIAWLIYRFDSVLLDWLVPLFRAEWHILMPAFHLEYLDWKIERHETVIALTATLTEHRLVLGQVLPPGVTTNVSTLAAHAWVHPVLMFSLLAAWPGVAWKHKPLLLLLAFPLVFLAELLDIPLMLWGAVEDVLYWGVDQNRVRESVGSVLQHFLDGGGRYAVSIGLTVLAIALFRKIVPRVLPA